MAHSRCLLNISWACEMAQQVKVGTKTDDEFHPQTPSAEGRELSPVGFPLTCTRFKKAHNDFTT